MDDVPEETGPNNEPIEVGGRVCLKFGLSNTEINTALGMLGYPVHEKTWNIGSLRRQIWFVRSKNSVRGTIGLEESSGPVIVESRYFQKTNKFRRVY